MGIRLFSKRYRLPIYAVYGFVRYADEIVDTFHEFPQKELLADFKHETFYAIERGMSTNPIIHSFQWVVNLYKLDESHIESFLSSMEADLYKKNYSPKEFRKYVYGSAEVIGLMCLKIFCDGEQTKFDQLKENARRLGKAFQKVNFLRDIKSDYYERGRLYFPEIDIESFDEEKKAEIIDNIKNDFEQSLTGIKKLNKGARLGVFLAYTYYLKLLRKIERTSPAYLIKKRIRVGNLHKILLIFSVKMRSFLGLI